MANTASSKKALRVSARRNKINKRVKDNFKSARKSVLAAIESGDKKAISTKLSEAYSSIDFAIKKGVIKKNTGDRYKSRLANSVNKAQA